MYCLIALVSFCMVSCGESFGIVFNTLVTDSNGFALNLASSLITVVNVMAGEHFPCFLFSSSGTEMGVFRYHVHRYAWVLQEVELRLSEQIRHSFLSNQDFHEL